MDISQYLFDHYIMLTELIGLMALLATGVHLSEATKRATRVTVFLIILESIMFSMEQWTQYNDGHILLRALLTAGIYCMHPIIVTAIIEMTAPVKKHKIPINKTNKVSSLKHSVLQGVFCMKKTMLSVKKLKDDLT